MSNLKDKKMRAEFLVCELATEFIGEHGTCIEVLKEHRSFDNESDALNYIYDRLNESENLSKRFTIVKNYII